MTQRMHDVTTYKESNVYDLRFICCNLQPFYISFTPLLSSESVVGWTSISSLLSLFSSRFFFSSLTVFWNFCSQHDSPKHPSLHLSFHMTRFSLALSIFFSVFHPRSPGQRGQLCLCVSRGSSVRFPPAGVSLSLFSRSQWGQGMAAALCPSLSCPTMPPCP